MKLAVFFPASLFSAWACSYGLVGALRRMGHHVKPIPIDPNGPSHPGVIARDWFKGVLFDGAIISGPEHIGKDVHILDAKMPKVAWLHETVEREDYGKLDVDAIKSSADIVFCPGIQDEKHGFRYLPFGADTTIFHPDQLVRERDAEYYEKPKKSIDAGFIGLLYPKRQAFLAELKKHGVNLVTGNVQVLELGGINPRKTAELYAENIRKMKVFVNLPTLSQLAVTKIYEVLACGVPVLTPEVSEMRNLKALPVGTYKTAADVAEYLKCWKYTHAGDASDNMHANHRLELRCEVLVSALKEIGVKESVLA